MRKFNAGDDVKIISKTGSYNTGTILSIRLHKGKRIYDIILHKKGRILEGVPEEALRDYLEQIPPTNLSPQYLH